MVRLGRKENMQVLAISASAQIQSGEQTTLTLSYGTPHIPHIPFTNAYLDYLGAAIEDAVKKTDMDGFMIDWLWNPGATLEPYLPLQWIDCEKVMFSELMNRPFPGKNIHPEEETEFRRKSNCPLLEAHVKEAAKSAKPDCIVWLTCCEVTSKDVIGSTMFKEVDWLMNEAGDMESLTAVKNDRAANQAYHLPGRLEPARRDVSHTSSRRRRHRIVWLYPTHHGLVAATG